MISNTKGNTISSNPSITTEPIPQNTITGSIMSLGNSLGNSLGASLGSTSSDSTVGATPDNTVGATPDSTVGATPDSTVGATPDSTVGATPDSTVGATPDSTVGATPDSNIPSYLSSRPSIQSPIDYKYIEDDELNKRFGFCMDTENKTFKVYLAMFSINQSCFIEGVYEENEYTNDITDDQSKYNTRYPFLQFCMETKEDTYSFPQMEYECPIINTSLEETGEQDSEEKPQEQTHFETECFKYLLSMLSDDNIIHTKNIDISNLYKGFMEYDESSIFVFFDISTLLSEVKRELTLAIIDEIVYKKIIYSTPVDPTVSDFFKKNKQLCNIKTTENQVYPFPFQLYLCDFKEGEYENIRSDNTQTYVYFEHPFFGIAHYFTTLPIMNTDVPSLKRFSCFITNGLYIKGDIDSLEEEEKEKYQNQLITASSFYFHENLLQLWGIKNISHFIQY